MYKYNASAAYSASPIYQQKRIDVDPLCVRVKAQASVLFQVKVDNPFTKYLYPDINDDSIPKMWKSVTSLPLLFIRLDSQLRIKVNSQTQGMVVSFKRTGQ